MGGVYIDLMAELLQTKCSVDDETFSAAWKNWLSETRWGVSKCSLTYAEIGVNECNAQGHGPDLPCCPDPSTVLHKVDSQEPVLGVV